MTDIRPSAADQMVKNPPKDVIAALLFGPDQGLVRERAEALMKTIVPNLHDPFLVADLDDQSLAADPARLGDEVAAISMLGGRRVVRVRGAGNGLAKLFQAFLDAPVGDALIVVEAGDIPKSGALPRVFIEADNAMAIACYGDTARDIPDVVRDLLRQSGFSIAPDALADAASRLGSDRGVTRREIEKLALYAHGKKEIALDDVRAVLGDEADTRAEEAFDAAGTGNFKALDVALDRLWVSGTSPVGLVRMAMSHFQRLALVLSRVESGETLDGALRALRPPLHFMRQGSFKAQLTRWDGPGLLAALDLLLETEALCKTTSVPAETVTSRALLNIAAMARRR